MTTEAQWQPRKRGKVLRNVFKAVALSRVHPLDFGHAAHPFPDRTMDMTGEYRIAASREAVWTALNDVEVLRACIPGCEEIERTSPNTMAAKVTQKIGPVKARFDGAIELLNVNAPKSYTIRGEGQGGVAGFAKGTADVTLTEENGATVLSFAAGARVGGKLARVGNRLIGTAAKKLATRFFDNFHAHLSADTSPEEKTARE